MIQISNIDFSYGRKKIFQNFSLKINRGETTLITGVNGAGKSTLLKLLAGVLVPDKGRVTNSEENIFEFKKNTGFISDSQSLYTSLTVKDSVELHRKMFDIDTMDTSMIRRAGISDDQKIKELSAGQKTIVHFSLIFSQSPKILLIDEVIHTLDAYLRQCVIDRLIEIMSSRELTVVFVNLNFHDIEFLINRVVLLKRGKILIDEDISTLKGKVRRVISKTEPQNCKILHTRSLGEENEFYIYRENEDTGQGVNLTEIIAAYIAGEYSNGQ